MDDAYGARSLLEKWAGVSLPAEVHSGAYWWQHGWQPQEFNVDPDLVGADDGMASYHLDRITFVAREDQVLALKSYGFTDVYAIGLPFAYALANNPPSLQSDRSGTLVVPTGHMTKENSRTDFTPDLRYIRWLRDGIKGDSSFEVMLTARDIALGRGSVWESKGFRVVRGADPDDSDSLSRLVNIFRRYDHVTTNDFGSPIAYAAAAGCRISVTGPQTRLEKESVFELTLYRNRPELADLMPDLAEKVLSRLKTLGVVCSFEEATTHQDWAMTEIGMENILLPGTARKFFVGVSGKNLPARTIISFARKSRRRIIAWLTQKSNKLQLIFLRSPGGGKPQLSKAAKNAFSLFFRGKKVSSLFFVNGNGRLFFRPATSDIDNILQHFVDCELEMLSDLNPKIVLDVGAYAGYSVKYFREIFPDARIVGIEADKDNFELATRNVTEGENIELVNMALSSQNGVVAVIEGSEGLWSKKVVPDYSGAHKVEAINLPSLARLLGIEKIDLLKLDVEGTEYSVLLRHGSWVAKNCRTLAVEYHHVAAHRNQLNIIEQKFSAERGFRKSELGEYLVYSFS